MKHKCLIIGVGSPFGNDDIALRVINAIRNKCLTDERASSVDVHYLDRPGMGLLEYWRNYAEVHLIDAICSPDPPGTLYHFEDFEHFLRQPRVLSSHGIGVAEVLELGQALNQLPPKLTIHAISIGPNPNSVDDAVFHDGIVAAPS